MNKDMQKKMEGLLKEVSNMPKNIATAHFIAGVLTTDEFSHEKNPGLTTLVQAIIKEYTGETDYSQGVRDKILLDMIDYINSYK